MKSSKRAFALLMTLIFALSSVFSFSATLAGAADFSDVADNNAYFEAITTLVEDGIINGYEDGTFKPDNTITRAEFSKLLATASAPSGTLFNATTTQFSDVADSTSSSAWAIPYIAYAVGVKAVNGYEDGTFRPTNTVTYGEAVKMIVCTLGYEPVVNKTLTPWYQGYVDIAAQIGLSKSAFAQGDTPAPRGLVAQLVFNMRECKPLVQTGLDINGNPTYGTGDSSFGESKDNATEEEGVVMGVIDYTLNGASVKKTQVLIGDEAYGIGKYSVDTLKEMVGYSVTFMFNAKDEITNIRKQSGENELITVDADMIASVSDTTLAYYKNEDDEYDNKTTAISLGDMYVVYNGVPVNPSDIGAGFDISDRLNVTDGKITFLSNDGNAKDAEVAFVESYVTYLANARPAENNGIWTLYDKFADKTGIAAVNLDEDTTTVKRITSKGGSASNATLGQIAEYDVVSVAMPYGTTENATVIISSVKPTETVQEMNSDYSYVKTNSGEYEVSPYFRTLQDKDVDVSFGNGDSGIFYFDRQGRIAYYKENRAVSPYKLAVRYGTKSEGVGLTYVLQVFEKGTSGFKDYTLNDSVRVNNTSMTAAEAVAHLEANAPKDYTGDYDNYIIQPVRIYTNSKGLVNSIDCMDSANDYAAGNVVPAKFENTANSAAAVFANDGKLTYASSVKSFNKGNSSQFRIQSSIVFAVPYDITAQYQYKIYSSFENTGSYCVEPYDMDGKNAGAVIYYLGETETTLAKIYTDTGVSIIEGITTKQDGDDAVKSVSYYKADGTLTSNVIDDEVNPAYMNDIKAGDLVKLAITDGKITTIRPVYMDGKLYASNGSAPLESGINHFKVSYDNKAGYYQAMVGAVQSFDYEGKFVEIIPSAVADGSIDDTNTLQLLLSGSAKYYKCDKNGKIITAEYGDIANEALEVKPATTTRVVAIVMNEAIVAMYQIPAAE